jgi:hypothetical protein
MKEKTQIRTVELVRRIRDDLEAETGGKSRSEVIAFYGAAGDAAKRSAGREVAVAAGERPARRRMAQG